MVKKRPLQVLLLLVRMVALVILLLGSGLTALAFSRSRLDYNFEGRYFDVEDSVVYHQDAVLVYGLLGGISIVLAIMLLAVTYYRKH